MSAAESASDGGGGPTPVSPVASVARVSPGARVSPVSPVDQAALNARVAQVSAVMRSHAGGVELVGVSPDGEVELRFTGMCQGCPFRPLTMHATIVPGLSSVPGVTAVRAPGARISEHAVQRLRRAVGAWHPSLPPIKTHYD